MECPFCYTNFEYRLSICPHCGKATDDPLYRELFSRVKPRKLEDEPAAPAQTAAPELAPAQAVELIDSPVTPPAFLAEEKREKPAITTEIKSKNTCNTLLDFPGKKTELPQWRLELQSRLKEIKEQRVQPAEISTEAIVAKKHAVGGTGLVMALLEEPQAPAHPLIEKALERIERSRLKYEPEEPARAFQAPSYQAPSYPPQTQTQTPLTPPATFAPVTLKPVTAPKAVTLVTPDEAEFEDGVRPFIFSENETVEDRLPQIGKDHAEKLARAKEIKNGLIAGEKFDTNRLRKFDHTVSFSNGAGTATAAVKYRTETVAPKMMPPREEVEEKAPVVTFEEEDAEEIAPFAFRFNAGLFDFIISAFLSLLILSPFVMLGGNWFTVEGAFAFLVTCSIVMFLYITTAVGLIGRTLGMGLFSLEMIDAEDNDYPTFNQAAVSSCVYLLSLALGGIGFATIFWNEERRAVHDLISGTVVVREN